ncbi:MAG: hypothetical protein ICV80_04160 [Microcoleus sp. T1-bin1]|nr:hypothetical protein [Microcoleus sp. T1-bin1]
MTLVQDPRFIFEVNLKSFDAIASSRERSPNVSRRSSKISNLKSTDLKA